MLKSCHRTSRTCGRTTGPNSLSALPKEHHAFARRRGHLCACEAVDGMNGPVHKLQFDVTSRRRAVSAAESAGPASPTRCPFLMANSPGTSCAPTETVHTIRRITTGRRTPTTKRKKSLMIRGEPFTSRSGNVDTPTSAPRTYGDQPKTRAKKLPRRLRILASAETSPCPKQPSSPRPSSGTRRGTTAQNKAA